MPAIDTNPADYPSNIWMTDTMTKVRQDAGSPGTTHWGTFYGTQNEFVDFQVHVQAGSGGISNLSVTASDFVNAKTGTTISASSTRIIVYREAYINVSPIVSAVSIRSTALREITQTSSFLPSTLISIRPLTLGHSRLPLITTKARGSTCSSHLLRRLGLLLGQP